MVKMSLSMSATRKAVEMNGVVESGGQSKDEADGSHLESSRMSITVI